MAKMTIAQQREKAVYQLAQRKNLTPTEQDIQAARRTMNSFYRLNTIFKKDYNACLVYFGYCPTICENGTTQDLYLRHFYN